MAEPAHAGALRLPEPDATLASRLLRLVQLIATRSGSAEVRRPSEPAVTEGQPGAARVTAALAELGRVAGEPQHGGWRVLLLPLGFEGAPLLRLYLREDPDAGNHGGADQTPSGRALPGGRYSRWSLARLAAVRSTCCARPGASICWYAPSSRCRRICAARSGRSTSPPVTPRASSAPSASVPASCSPCPSRPRRAAVGGITV